MSRAKGLILVAMTVLSFSLIGIGMALQRQWLDSEVEAEVEHLPAQQEVSMVGPDREARPMRERNKRPPMSKPHRRKLFRHDPGALFGSMDMNEQSGGGDEEDPPVLDPISGLTLTEQVAFVPVPIVAAAAGGGTGLATGLLAAAGLSGTVAVLATNDSGDSPEPPPESPLSP